MKTLILMLLFSVPAIGFGQLINSNQTTVGEFYDADIKSVEVNGTKVTGQLKIIKFKQRYESITKSAETTAEKNNALFVTLGLTNISGNLLNLNKFDFKKNNGFSGGLTFQHSFSNVYLSTNTATINPRPLNAFLGSVDYKQDKFSNYDPATQKISTAKPKVFGVRGSYSRYFFNYKSNAKIKYSFVPTFSAKINFKDYNAPSLLNYLKNDNLATGNGIIYTSSSSYDGKYGTVVNDIKTGLVAVSFPIVPEKSRKKLPVLSPIPYASYEFFEKSKPRLNAGFAIGILSDALLGDVSAAGNTRKFNVPSYLSIGIDWNYQDGKGSKPNYFVAGSIKFK